MGVFGTLQTGASRSLLDQWGGVDGDGGWTYFSTSRWEVSSCLTGTWGSCLGMNPRMPFISTPIDPLLCMGVFGTLQTGASRSLLDQWPHWTYFGLVCPQKRRRVHAKAIYKTYVETLSLPESNIWTIWRHLNLKWKFPAVKCVLQSCAKFNSHVTAVIRTKSNAHETQHRGNMR